MPRAGLTSAACPPRAGAPPGDPQSDQHALGLAERAPLARWARGVTPQPCPGARAGPSCYHCPLHLDPFLRWALKPAALDSAWDVWCEACSEWIALGHRASSQHLARLGTVPRIHHAGFTGGGLLGPGDPASTYPHWALPGFRGREADTQVAVFETPPAHAIPRGFPPCDAAADWAPPSRLDHRLR